MVFFLSVAIYVYHSVSVNGELGVINAVILSAN